MLVGKGDIIRNQIIRLVVRKCRKDAIEATFRKWGRLSEETLSSLKGKTKDKMTQILIAAVDQEEQDMTDEIIGGLELSYVQLHSRSKLWKVYRLSGSDMMLSHDPRTLRSHLLANVQLKWKHGRVFGNMSFFGGGLWLRIHLSTSLTRRKAGSNVYNPANSLFVVTFTGSQHVIVNQCSSRILRIVSEALIQTFKAEHLHDIKLSGQHVASLADIALKKNSEAETCTYRQLEEDGNPLIPGRKRKLSDEEFEDRDNMIDENRKEKRMRGMDIVKKFGPEPQPILETLEYNFDLPFRGKTAGEFPDGRCKSTVQLKGPSVLEGLCEMARKGFLKFPLPQHLSSAVRSQRNNFNVVSRKDRPQ